MEGGKNVDKRQPIWKIITVASIAVGVQFGWSLQLSVLTPYAQTLGVNHMWAAFIWLCGPFSGFLVQPIVGYFSDHSTSKLGRRRPFILAGTFFVAVAVILIGFAKDIGYKAGDDMNKTMKPRAVAIFVVGFWVLDVANNMIQGPCRALLADMSGNNHGRMRVANNCFSFFMAVGNVLGYAAGSRPMLYQVLPFTITTVCDENCANLKTLFLIDVGLLTTIVGVATSIVKENPLSSKKDTGPNESSSAIGDASSLFKSLSKKMWLLYAVTAVNWIGWFPWLLYDTDWMGREVYGGKPQGTALEKTMYDTGVRAGSLGLMLNAIVLAVASLLVEPMSNLVGGVKRWWCVVNFFLGIGLVLTIPVTKAAEAYRAVNVLILPSSNIKGAALGVFALLGIPLAVNFSVPFALASMYSNTLGGGQGLSLGLLNLAIVIPQIIVSLVSGVIDNYFGGGNLPAFIMGAIASFVSALMALIVLPDTPCSESIVMNFYGRTKNKIFKTFS